MISAHLISLSLSQVRGWADSRARNRRASIDAFRPRGFRRRGNWKFWDFVVETQYVTDAERLGDSFVAEVYLSDAVSATILKKARFAGILVDQPHAASQASGEGNHCHVVPPTFVLDRINRILLHATGDRVLGGCLLAGTWVPKPHGCRLKTGQLQKLE